MKYIISTILLMFSLNANAIVVNLNGKQIETSTLSTEQQKLILSLGEDKKVTIPEPEDIKAYSEIGKTISGTLSQIVKDLNVNMNDFMSTKLGTLTMLILVYYFIKGPIIAFLVFTGGLYAIRKFKYSMYPKNYVFDKDKTNVFGNAKINSYSEEEMSSDASAWIGAMYIVLILVSMLIAIAN